MAKTAVKEKPTVASAVEPQAGALAVAAKPEIVLDVPHARRLTPQEIKKEWDEYIEVCRLLLDDSDYMYYACGKKPDGFDLKPMAFRTRDGAEGQLKAWAKLNFRELLVRETKKRSAWDKLAKAFNISTPAESDALCAVAEISQVGEYVVEKLIGDSFKIVIYQDAATLTVKKVSVLLRVVSPNGRTILGDGACSVTERKNGAESFAHADHDVFSTAFTRAFNRAVSRCIGTGEVSSEEFEASAPPDSTNAGNSVEAAPTQNVSKEAPVSTVDPREAPKLKDESKQDEPKKREERKNETVAPPPGPPRAEIPNMDDTAASAKQSSFPRAAPTSEPPSQKSATASYTPLSDSAALSDRVRSIQNFLFGSERPNNHLVKYLLIAIAPTPKPSYDVERNGRIDGDKWNAAVKSLEDRAERGKIIERELAALGRDKFVEWANSIIGAARVKKLFG